MASVLTVPTITSTTPATRCDTGIVTLEAVGSAGILNWYDSDKGGTQVGTGNTISTPSISLTTPFYVDTTEAGCTSLRTAVLASIYPIDTDDKEVVLCQTKTATLDASIPGLDYLWSPGGEITQSINVSTIGNYEVIISSPIATSCGSKKIFNVIEHPKPVIAELITDDTTLTILLTDPKEYYEFSIDGVLFQKSNQFSYILSGQQTAYVRENNTCNLIEQDFTIFSISKYFTPNNDGINDTWLIPEMKDYPGSNVKIFDRYGKLLKQLNAGIIGWNGKFNNIDLPADDYWYVLKLESNQPEIRAHFTLKR
jgi:gliding motility-associated-like protein